MWPNNETTQELLDAAGEGSERAVNDLLVRHRPAIHRLVQLRLDQRIQRRVDVSDVVQEVMSEASRRLQDYLKNPAMNFRLWVRQIARDRIIDAHRRHRVSAKRSVDREQPMVTGGMEQSTLDLAAQLWDREITPATAATERELLKCIEGAIGQLTDQDREIIVMRHYEQLSNQEVAQTLELTEPAASMRYLRAVRRLRELLDEEG